jgi:hypothetical protein
MGLKRGSTLCGQAMQLITSMNKFAQGGHITGGNTAVFYPLIEEPRIDPGQRENRK